MPQQQQRDEALSKANAIRIARSNMKREIRVGRRRPENVLRLVPDFAAGMRVDDFLRALPHYGRARIKSLLLRCHVRGDTELGELTDWQRDALAGDIQRHRKG